MGENKNLESIKNAEAKLYQLVDEKLITPEVFEAIKPALVKPQTQPRPAAARRVYQSDKPIRGTGAGFCLGFFLGVIGLILGLTISDDDAKSGAIKGFITSLVIGVVAGIIYAIVVAVMINSYNPGYGDYYYIQLLLSLL